MRITITESGHEKHRGMFCSLLMFTVIVMLGIGCGKGPEKGWMTYRSDIARSGVTEEPITAPLSLSWMHKPRHAPKPAWYEPSEELPRSHFDNAHYVTSTGGLVYFGSSVDNKVYALKAKSGKIEWTYQTEGPVRCVPTISNQRIYFGSDDGYVYCLHAVSGKLFWKYRAGPSDEKVLGNGTMISLRPVRTSVLVDDGVVYFCAGVFPHEGIYICALDAGDGSVIWKNDTMGDHSHELSFNGISPQGYLIASETTLYVPSGRALPAAFDRKTGKFLFYMNPGSKFGGTWALLDKNELITGVDRSGTPAKGLYDSETGKRKGDAYAWYPGIDMVVDPVVSYIVTVDGIVAINRSEYADAEKKVRENENQRKEQEKSLQELREKLTGANTAARTELNARIKEISTAIATLNEETVLYKKSGKKWIYSRKNLHSLICAGDVFAGGEGFVEAVDAQTGKELWSETVDGTAFGLAAADGCLYVSTDTGTVYCFKEGTGSMGKVIEPPVNPEPYPKDRLTDVYDTAVEDIIKKAGIDRGWCLVLDSDIGRLAYELARRTNLNIIGIEHDSKKLRQARKRLDEAGLLGDRIRIENWDIAALPDYFANLIVSDGVITSQTVDYSPDEVFRVLRPCGGVVYFKQPSGKKVFASENQGTWLGKPWLYDIKAVGENSWFAGTRGKLKGSSGWTHIFGNPQNTACSGDNLVKGALGVLWFGEPGPKRMVDRHAKATSPVSANGRLFVQGDEIIMAYDAYNGAFLWEREIPGAVRVRAGVDGGNLVITDDDVYVAARDICYRLDAASGKEIRRYELPPSTDGNPHRWGIVSCTGKILYGTRAVPLKEEYGIIWSSLSDNGKWVNRDDVPLKYKALYDQYVSRYPAPDQNARKDFQRMGRFWGSSFDANFPKWENYDGNQASLTGKMMVSDKIFAIDADSGEILWVYDGNKIAHITVSIGEGKLYFAESTVSAAQKNRARRTRQTLIGKGIYREAEKPEFRFHDVDVRNVIALDAVSGKKLWESPVDLTSCGGDAMGSALYNDMLFFFSNVGSHDAWRHINNDLTWKRITALSADRGETMWSRALNYRTRPLIVGDRIILEPHACDYRTGEIVTRTHPVTEREVPWEFLRPGHTCAITSASSSMLFTRSYTALMYDMEGDRGVTLFGGIRPGCFINMIPANGLLLMPEASSGCTCSFPLRCSVVFKPENRTPEEWSVFVSPGDITPVRHFAINLGAPADMRDGDGTVWFGYPNPKTEYGGNHYKGYGVKFNLNDTVLDNMGYFAGDFRGKEFEGTDKPWLYTTGCLGLTRCEVPLIDADDNEPGDFTVRLGFLPQKGDRIGSRVFDISFQGEIVHRDFDIMQEGGTQSRPVIMKFTGIHVDHVLTIELLSKSENPAPEQAPVLNFIEIEREDVRNISMAD